MAAAARAPADARPAGLTEADVAPVTVRLEHQVGRMLTRMIGFGDAGWAHLCSGGTIANIEALWVARSVRYLGLAVQDVRRQLGLTPASAGDDALMSLSPDAALDSLERLFTDTRARSGERAMWEAHELLCKSVYNPADVGMSAVVATATATSAAPQSRATSAGATPTVRLPTNQPSAANPSIPVTTATA